MGWPGIAVALCLAVASMSFILALARTSVANTLILMSAGPYVTGLLGWFLLGERVRFRTWGTMAVAMGGAVVMVSSSYVRGSVGGDLLALMMAGAFATATVLVRRHPTILMTPAAALGAGLTCLLALPMAAPLRASTRDIALLAVFGIGQFAVGFLLFIAGARLIPAAETSLIGMIETVLGPLWVWLALGENPGLASLLGGTLIVGALLTHTLLDLLDPRPRPGASPA
jgi:drug/metabolite transporter (DMT)-like permease